MATFKAIPNLKTGSRGPNVTKLQQYLNSTIACYGYVTQLGGNGKELAADGIFGPQTAAWVKFYQTSNQLKVDGIVGPKTQEALFNNGVIFS
jgi:peptidoglycan hydrolase-like protein with peptidoglycan-binding domain